jgi:hypothetical protein
VFKSTDHAASLFALKEFGNITDTFSAITFVLEQRGSEQEFAKPLNWRALKRLGQTASCRAGRKSLFQGCKFSDSDLSGRRRHCDQAAEAATNRHIPLMK